MKRKNFFVCVVFAIILAIGLTLGGCSGGSDNNDGGGSEATHDLGKLTIACEGANDIVYDGTPKKVAVSVRTETGKTLATLSPDGESADFTLAFDNNVNAGTAEVTVTAKATSKYKGSAKGTFTIEGAIGGAGDGAELIALFDSGNYREVNLTADVTVGADEVLNIPENATLDSKGFLLVNEGKIINRGFLKIRQISGEKSFINDGECINDNKIMLYASQVVNRGKMENNGAIVSVDGQGALYTNGPVLGEGGETRDVGVFVRYPINDCDISLEYEKTPYTGTARTPKIKAEINGEPISANEYELIYGNNVNAGVASVTVRAKENALTVFGEKVFNFDVERASVRANNETDFIEKLGNPNYAEIRLAGIIVSSDAVIGADKTVIADGVEFNGKVTVEGRLTANNGAVKLGGETTIAEGGELLNDGVIHLSGSVSGNGKAKNAEGGKVFIFATGETSCEWENEGNIYVDEGYPVAASGTGRVVERRRLTAESASITNDGVKYDGTAKFPQIGFADGLAPQAGTYGADAYRAGSADKVSSPTDKGKYDVKVTFFGWSEDYYGSFMLEYNILPGEVTVQDESDLRRKIANDNYGTVITQGDIILKYAITVGAWQELIIGSNVKFSNATTINVYGKVTNDGNFAEAGKENGLTVSGEGSFVNNGTAYFNGTAPDGVSGEGTVFVRENIADAVSFNFTAAEKIVYGDRNTTVKPTFGLKFGEEELTADDDYSVAYENYMEVSVSEEEPAVAVASAKVFSQKAFGEKRMEYLVLPGKTRVYNFTTLMQETANVRKGTDLCNWGEIELTANISATNNGTTNQTLTIRKNTTLVLNGYTFELNWGTSKYNKYYYIVNDGIITTKIPQVISSGTYSGKGKIIGLVDDSLGAYDITKMAGFCDEIRLQSDVTKNDAIGFSGAKQCTIDLCGYTLNAKISVHIDNASITITSTGGRGTIGSAEKSPTVTVDGAEYGNTLTLKNLDVYGIKNYSAVSAAIITENSVVNQ